VKLGIILSISGIVIGGFFSYMLFGLTRY